MAKKPNIIVFIDWYLPAYKAGGPIVSVKSMVAHLKAHFNFFIVTGDRDLGDIHPHPGISLDEWLTVDQINVIYLSEKKQKLSTYRDLLSEIAYDYVYLNGVFSLKFTLLPLISLLLNGKDPNIIITPHGMLGPGALGIKKLKKLVFLSITKVLGLFKKVIWHASNYSEAEDIEKVFGVKTQLNVIPHLPQIYHTSSASKKEIGSVKFIYLSRVTEKKNLGFFLECLTEQFNGKIELNIYGLIDDSNYWKQCKSIPIHSSVRLNYHGPLTPSHISEKLGENHFFVLPTLHENFGYAIIEALSCGCPVILSSNTPWNDVEQFLGGWAQDLDTNKFRDIIRKCLNMNDSEYQEMRKKSVQYVKHKFDMGNIYNAYLEMFRKHHESVKN